MRCWRTRWARRAALAGLAEVFRLLAEERQRLLEEVADAAGADGLALAEGARALVVEAPVEVREQGGPAVGALPLRVDEAGLDPLGQERRLPHAAPGDQRQDVRPVGPGRVEPGEFRLAAQEELGGVVQEAGRRDRLHGPGKGGDDLAQIPDELTEQVGGVGESGGVPGDAPQAIEMGLLAGRRVFGVIHEEVHAVMEREEGLPLRVGEVGEVAELGAEVGVLLQELRLGLEVLGDCPGIGRRARLRAHEMDHCGTAADVAVELRDGEDLALLAEVLLDFHLAIGSGEVLPERGAKAGKSCLGLLELARDARDEEAVAGGRVVDGAHVSTGAKFQGFSRTLAARIPGHRTREAAPDEPDATCGPQD